MSDLRSKNSVYAYGIYAASLVVLIIAIFTYNPIAISITAGMLLLSVIYMNSGHLINSVLVRNLRVIEISDGYKVAANMHSVVRKSEYGYRSVSIAVLKPASKIETSSMIFEELLDKVKIPFEFSISLRKLDSKKILEGLETKRRMKELELSQSESDYKTANMLKRQISTIENEIAVISDGNEPIEALVKLKSFADAETEGEAARSSLKQAEHVANLVASSFKLDYTIATGEDILDLL